MNAAGRGGMANFLPDGGVNRPIRPAGWTQTTELADICAIRQQCVTFAYRIARRLKQFIKTNSFKGQIADFTRAEMIEQRQVNIFGVGLRQCASPFRPANAAHSARRNGGCTILPAHLI